MGDRGQKRINTHFTWEAVTDQYEKIYHDSLPYLKSMN